MLVRNPLLKKTHSLAVAVRDRARDGLKRLRS
jgi:hypothetical protein